MKAIIIILGALVVIFCLWFFLGERELDTDTGQENIGSTESDLVPYSNSELGFSIMRPQDSTVSIEGDGGTSAKIMLLGPEAIPNSEITDGFTVTITRGDASATSTEVLAETRISELESNGGEAHGSPEEDTINGMSALRYSFTTLLGNTATEYVFLENSWAYFVTTSIFDPGGRNYGSVVSEMLDTLTFE